MKLYNIFSSILFPSLILLGLVGMTGCNTKSESEEIYTPSSSVAVTSFSLKSDRKVAANLDSVFFSIDLDKKVIYNADSLPKGTRTDKLVPVISYPSTVTGATVIMNGERLQSESDYKKNPSDTLDFSGLTILRLTAEDGVTSIDYEIKVNVHKMNPDSIYWSALSSSTLPARLPNPISQKSVKKGETIFTLVQERDNSYTLSTTDDLFAPQWEKTAVTFPSAPQVRTLVATETNLYILAENGTLMESADGKIWNSLNVTWSSMIGAYGDKLLGVRVATDGLVHTSYPTGSFAETPVEKDFPVSGASNLGVFETKWAATPIVILFGGVTSDGSYSSHTWGFDGTSWVRLTENSPIALKEPTLVPYVNYKSTNALWIHTEYPVWLLIGGEQEDGTINRKVFISYDNGVNWRPADIGMQLPMVFPALYAADAIVENADKTASLSAAWKTRMTMSDKRRNVTVSGEKVSWEAPYIFIFGGFKANGSLNDEIWSGVLGRVISTPIF